jgi:predicted TIM-barrel fold metal-dependent hydrolase
LSGLLFARRLKLGKIISHEFFVSELRTLEIRKAEVNVLLEAYQILKANTLARLGITMWPKLPTRSFPHNRKEPRTFTAQGSPRWIVAFCCIIGSSASFNITFGQENRVTSTPSSDLPLNQFLPKSRLKTPQTPLLHARYPVVDLHTHFHVRLRHDLDSLDNFVKVMDRNSIAVCISLDGTLGDRWFEHKKYLQSKYAHRFAIFANIDFIGKGVKEKPETWDSNQPEFVRWTCERLREAAADGACGLKFFKQFGLEYRNRDGSLTQIDDPRFDPIWRTCAELSLPVIMHTADPSAFFEPIDATNERFEELSRHPEWAFPADKFPSRASLLEARNRVIAKHPATKFIAAHMGNDGEDLTQAAEWLDQFPNLYLEIASRISELGRQPYSARRFVIRYQDRILFGTDGPWPEERLRLYWRFLETEDEYFPYSEKPFPPQGFWNIYGINLPDDVLRKIYYQNAIGLIPGLKAKYENTIAVMKSTPDKESSDPASK